MKQINGHYFRPEEIISMRRLNRKTGEWSETEFPTVGGRLRIAHEQNDSISITSEIVQYDGLIAVVKSLCATDKGNFSGVGMASIERDAKIAPAILELAETRALARALRFSGIGVEFCSAEEVSHLDNGKPSSPPAKNTVSNHQHHIPDEQLPPPEEDFVHTGGNGGNRSNNKGRLSQKQHSFLLSLAGERGLTQQALDNMSKDRYGSVVSFLNKNDASNMIKEMTTN